MSSFPKIHAYPQKLIYSYEQKNYDDLAADNTVDMDDSAMKNLLSLTTDSKSHSASRSVSAAAVQAVNYSRNSNLALYSERSFPASYPKIAVRPNSAVHLRAAIPILHGALCSGTRLSSLFPCGSSRKFRGLLLVLDGR